MLRVLAVQNCATEGFGRYGSLLAGSGADIHTFPAWRRPPFPSPNDFAAILVGGTPAAAYDRARYPFLQDEFAFLDTAVRRGVPCLGVCCGAQLLAAVLGAAIGPSARKEIGVFEAVRTPAGTTDPLLTGFPQRFPVFQWHGDTFDVPAGAALLVEGVTCTNQLFRFGNVIGAQFHLEVAPDDAAAWADAYAAELAAYGGDRDELVAACRRADATMHALAKRLIHNFVDHYVRPAVRVS